MLAGVLPQCAALAHLILFGKDIGAAGAERLAGMLLQCTALTHLNLGYNQIGDPGAERLAAVLGQCASLAYLNLSCNNIGAGGKGRLRASWRCQASGLVLPFKALLNENAGNASVGIQSQLCRVRARASSGKREESKDVGRE